MTFAEDLWYPFMLAYGVFVIWSIVTWVVVERRTASGPRGWLGALGLCSGVISALLFLAYLMSIVLERRLIAHGSVLWIYYYSGESLGVLGIFLGLAGKGRTRFSSVIVSVVMVFQWLGAMVYGRRVEALSTNAMYLSVAMAIGFAAVHRLLSQKR
jgi:hypothetical protein